MERLILLRHGKAEASAASGDDFDRALTPRGVADSALVARTLAQAGLQPDLVLVSDAARARQTWEASSAAFPPANVIVLPSLYNAAPEAILALVEGHEDEAGTIMVVAHNPGLFQLSLALAQKVQATPADRAALNAGLPTAAASVIDLPGQSFRLFTPRALGGGA